MRSHLIQYNKLWRVVMGNSKLKTNMLSNEVRPMKEINVKEMKKRQRKTQILHQKKLHELFEKHIQQCEGVLDQTQSTIDEDGII